jgi:hypothetical protein
MNVQFSENKCNILNKLTKDKGQKAFIFKSLTLVEKFKLSPYPGFSAI